MTVRPTALLFAATLLFASAVHAGELPGLAPYRFLIGTWVSADGHGGDASKGNPAGRTVFSRGLMDRVIIRNNIAGNSHEDLMVIFVEGDSTVRAEYFDNEGHRIHYAVESPAAGKAVFLSLPSPGAPRYRLTYSLASDGSLEGAFEIAPAGEGGNFAPYLHWTSKPDSAHPVK